MRFCFSLGWVAVLLAPALLADEPAAPMRRISRVRVDAGNVRLVRAVAVMPVLVTEKAVTPQLVAPRVVTPATPAADEPEVPEAPVANIDRAVARIAAQHALNPLLIHSVIKVESNYNPLAVSPKGALGLMQLIPSTARRFGVSNVFNPVENIQGGARYLRYLLDLYNGDYRLALAAYNAGEAAVARFGGVPPFAETQNYVLSVHKRFQESRRAETRQPEKEPKSVEPKPAGGPGHIHEVVELDGTVRYVSR